MDICIYADSYIVTYGSINLSIDLKRQELKVSLQISKNNLKSIIGKNTTNKQFFPKEIQMSINTWKHSTTTVIK